MKFLVDAQLPPALAVWLRGKGYDAVHVEDAALRDSDDAQVREFAVVQERIVVTKDRDFVASPQIGSPPAVLWVRTGNAPTRVVLERLEANWVQLESYLAQGFALVELR